PPLPRAGEGAASPGEPGVRAASLLPISARSPEALPALVRAYVELLGGSPPLRDLCYTAAARRTHHEYRLTVVGSTPQEMAGSLSAFLAGAVPEEVAVGQADPDVRRRLVFVFSGQGSQWVGMGRTLLEDEPIFREKVEACDALFRPLAGWSLLEELTAPPERSRLHQTEVTQPVLFAIQVALAELWRSRGVRADGVVGHSVGEVAAAHFAGVLELEQAICVVFHRGRLMQRATGAGRMAAVGLDRRAAEAFLAQRGGGISLAAVNGPSSTVLSGDSGAVEEAVAELTERGVFARLLPIDLASHSPQMEPLQTELVDALAGLAPHPPTLPLFSTVTGQLARPGDFDAEYWGRNLREPVLFAQAIGAAARAADTDFLEISPHPLLRTPLEQCAGEADALIVSSLESDLSDPTALLRSLGALHSRGHIVDWSALHPSAGKVVQLPSYPWQRQRYWIAPTESGRRSGGERARSAESRAGRSPFAGQLLTSPAIEGSVFESHLSAEALAIFGDHRIGEDVVLPAACFVGLLLTAGRTALGSEVLAVEDLSLHRPLIVPDDGEPAVQCILQPPADGRVACEIHSRAGDQQGGWTLHATAALVVGETPVNGARRASSLAEIRARLGNAEDGESDGSLKTVESIQRREGETLARLRLATGEAEELARAALLDTCFRLLAATGSTALHPRDSSAVASLQRLRLYQPITAAVLCHARRRDEEDAGSGAFIADARLFDADGQLLAEVEGVRFARVSRAEEWLYEVRWRRCGILSRSHPVPAAALPSPGGIVEHLMAIPPRVREPAGQSAALATELHRLSAVYAARALRGLGLPLVSGESFAMEDIGDQMALSAHHRRLLQRILAMLQEDGMIEPVGTGWRVLRAPEQIDSDAAVEQLLERFPEHRTELTLFRRCASRIAHVLHGECDPLELLFPDGSADEIERFYREAPLSRAPNLVVRQAIQRVADDLPEGRVLRLLEIGAGTGSTTSHLLDVLPPRHTEYVFTDVSCGFLDRAATEFREYPFVRFELLDIEQDPEAQGFAAEQFDLVLAANVLHATAELRSTLMRVRRLLRPGGLLFLLEGAQPTRWIDLVFGLTEGWWKFADADLRPSHPLLPPRKWAALLEECGFSEARTIGADSGTATSSIYPQALIVARVAAGTPLLHSGAVEPVMGSWLIVADRTSVGHALAAAVQARGGECTLALPQDAPEVARTWRGAGRARPAAVVYLSEAAATGEATAAGTQDRARAGCTFLAALALALSDADSAPQPRLWIVTRGAQPLDGGDAVDPAGAALWGMGRSLALECPESWGGLIDLEVGSDPASDAEQLLAQITADDSEDQVAFRAGTRFVPRLVPVRDMERAEPVLRADGAYLVTGGLGSLGLKLARWLAGKGAGHLVLLGRTRLPHRSTWASLPQSYPAHARVAAVLDLERLGAAVTTVAGDVTDGEAMGRLLARFGSELPPLKGVFHTAAVMDFTPLRRLQPEEIDAVLRPKVAGGWILHELTRELALDHFVLFSSVAGLWGSRGMAHYAAANQFLDALAHHRRALGLPALAVNWGGWEGGGSSAAASRFLEQSDFHLLPAEAALERLGAAMAAGVTQRTIASVDWNSLKASYELHRPRPFLSEVHDAGDGVAGSRSVAHVAAPAGLLQELEALAAEEASDLLASHVRGQVAEVLGLDPAQLTERGQGFFKLGMDSLMTVELRGRLERSMGLRLPTTIASVDWNSLKASYD
ncbi:MAG TPA: SDR family NAD(P)-dependent oxidoreductase, partial [Longimicrobiaceae bacterium]|nr:SDR family NAD(P)-dependent oxidoreductase [Longimicrobiaceae bacterium]